jgi:hypothetical protein
MKKSMTPLKHIEKFNKWNWFKEKIEPYITDQICKYEAKEFVLPRYMFDSEIKSETKSDPIPVEILASFIQKNCTDKSKWYVMHVQTPSESVAAFVVWDVSGWYVDASGWAGFGGWFAGDVFLSFATARTPDTLKSDATCIEDRKVSSRNI